MYCGFILFVGCFACFACLGLGFGYLGWLFAVINCSLDVGQLLD